MTQRTFLTQMGIISLIISVLLVIIYSFPSFQTDWVLGLISWIFFAILTFLMFFLGKKAAASKNRHNFTSLVLGITAMKMFLSVAIVLVYFSLVRPTSRVFVLPFLLVYVIYTIYETYMLMILSKEKPKGIE